MEVKDIIALNKLGFSPEHIKQLDGANIENLVTLTNEGISIEDVLQLAPLIGTTPKPDIVQPTPQVQPIETVKPLEKVDVKSGFASLSAELRSLKETIQADNIRKSSMEQPVPESVDDILANHLNGGHK